MVQRGPASNANVYLRVQGTLKDHEIDTTNADGKYVLDGVETGKYSVWAELNELTSLEESYHGLKMAIA